MKNTAGSSLKFFVIILLLSFLVPSCKKDDTSGTDEQESQEIFRNDNKSLSHTKKYNADVANEWFNLLAANSRITRRPPAPSVRLYAFSAIALYESVVAGMPSYQSIYKILTNDTIGIDHKKNYYWPAAANAALARISEKIIKNYSASPDLSAFQQLEAKLNMSFQGKATAEQLLLSIELGKHVADKVYAWSTTDGTLNDNGTLAVCPAYVPLGTPGSWLPTPTGFFPAAGACQGSIRTFVPNIVNTTMPPPPPNYSTDPSSEFFSMANEVYKISLTLTDDDKKFVQSWRDFTPNFNAPSHTLKLASLILANENINLEDAAVLYAKLNIAASDAVASVFKAKFNYSLLRPITYIRNVMGHSTWNSVTPTPQHPAYVSTTAVTTATINILENYLGTNYAVIDSTQQDWIGTWSYPSLNAFAQRAAEAKILSGHNFRPSVNAAITQGLDIASKVQLLAFKKP